MIVKGIVSAIDTENDVFHVILPEYDNIVTRPIKAYTSGPLSVNDFVLVVVFNNDFNDCMILSPYSGGGGQSELEACENIKF